MLISVGGGGVFIDSSHYPKKKEKKREYPEKSPIEQLSSSKPT